MDAGGPRMMPAGVERGILQLADVKTGFGAGRIVVGCQVFAAIQKFSGLQIQFIVLGNSLFKRANKLVPFEFFKGALAIRFFVQAVKRIGESVDIAEKSGGLAQIAELLYSVRELMEKGCGSKKCSDSCSERICERLPAPGGARSWRREVRFAALFRSAD